MTGIAGLVLVAIRGLVAVAGANMPLAIGLGLAVILCVGLLVSSMRARGSVAPAVSTPSSSPSSPSLAPPRKPLPIPELVVLVVLIGLLVSLGGLVSAPAEPPEKRWTFLESAATPADLGFQVATPSAGPWDVELHEQATGARALVNREGEDAAPPATLLAPSVWTRDFRAVTRCKTVAPRAAQQCGIVFRYRDEANYTVARLDSVTKAVVVADVIGGVERPLARGQADVAPNVWHELRVEARAGEVTVWWNSRQAVKVAERLPAVPGKVGLWAPAAGIAYFDELSIERLPDSARTVEILPLLGRSRS